MEKWQRYRNKFPHVGQQVYLNHASIGPMFSGAVDAVQEYLCERSAGHIEYWPTALEKKQEFKELVGKLINADASQIAVTECTSTGLSWLARGINWQPGDRILLNNYEFPSNVYPFAALRQEGVEIDYVQHRDGRIELLDILENIHPKTRLLSISFVEFLNGYRNDLEKIGRICREHDILFSVDGIQGLGALPIDVDAMGIDFLASGGQKWLMWPLGTAFFYVAPRIFDELRPMASGWLSVQDPWEFFEYDLNYQPTAERFEPGMFNVGGVVGAIESLKMMLDIGIENIERRILEHSLYLSERLNAEGYRLATVDEPQHLSGIVSVYHDRPDDLFAYLQEKKIQVSLRNGLIRIAPHFYNTRSEIEQFFECLHKFDSTIPRARVVNG